MSNKLHSKGKKHSKRRNVGLMMEFLTKHIINCSLKDDDEGVKHAVKIIKQHFKPGTELYREWRLFNAVAKTQGVSETVANAILRETRKAVRGYNKTQLEREKSWLIKSVNHELGQGVYEHHVPEYRTLATIQTLFNDWRNTVLPDIGRIADYERKLQEHLMQPPDVQHLNEGLLEGQSDPVQDKLVVKLMIDKLNKRYAGKLNEVQRKILGMYALEGVSDDLCEDLEHLKEETLQKLDEYRTSRLAANDKFSVSKIDEARTGIEQLSTGELNESMVARFMKLCELKEELNDDR